MILRNILEQYWYDEHTKEGYRFIKTPIIIFQPEYAIHAVDEVQHIFHFTFDLIGSHKDMGIIHIKDSLGRDWQCGTVQLDMNLPERFECTYVDAD